MAGGQRSFSVRGTGRLRRGYERTSLLAGHHPMVPQQPPPLSGMPGLEGVERPVAEHQTEAGSWPQARLGTETAMDRVDDGMATMAAASEGGDGTDSGRPKRLDRELLELLNELRVVLPGVQALF